MSARRRVRRCPDCNAPARRRAVSAETGQMQMTHRPGCPFRGRLEAEARDDAARLLVSGATRDARPLTALERTELAMTRPDLDPDDYVVHVVMVSPTTRARAFVRQGGGDE